METSYNQNKKSAEQIIKNFDVRKNIPLDKRFLVANIDEIDTEIKVKQRFEGHFFFGYTHTVIEEENVMTGDFYYFDKDLQPKKFLDLFSDLQIKQLVIGETELADNDYTNLLTLLNQTTQNPGSMIQVLPLNVVFMFDGTNWNYLTGNYNVENEPQFNTIPVSLRKANTLVKFESDPDKIILSNGDLSNYLIEISEVPETIENERYYNYDGFLYIGLNGSLYQIGTKIFLINDHELLIGNNEITHNLNSSNITCLFRIYNNDNQSLEDGLTFNLDYKFIDVNNIMIKADVPLKGNIFITGLSN